MSTAPTDRVYFKTTRLKQFRALLKLSETHGFAGAGELLGLSRSSVLRQIRTLERELDCDLVQVRGREAQITDAGRLLLELVVPVLDDYENLTAEFRQRLKEGRRPLRVVAPYQLLVHEFPPAIERLKQIHLWLQLRLVSEPSVVALELVLRDEANIAVIGQMEGLHQRTELSCRPVATYHPVLLAPPKHPLAGKKKWTLKDLAGWPLILPNVQTSSRARFEAAFARVGLLERLQVVLECNTLAAILPYVRRGFGLGFHSVSDLALPELDEMQRRREITYRRMDVVFGDETVFFVTRKNRARLPHVEDFRRLLSDAAGG